MRLNKNFPCTSTVCKNVIKYFVTVTSLFYLKYCIVKKKKKKLISKLQSKKRDLNYNVPKVPKICKLSCKVLGVLT